MTTLTPNQLLVGIGSPHGDDRVGWTVAESVRAKCKSVVTVRTASVPLDLLDWLDGVDSLHVVDACLSGGSRGELTRWTWPELIARNSSEIPFRSTHGFDVVSALRLAETLGRLPSNVVVWGIEVGETPLFSSRERENGRRPDEGVGTFKVERRE